MSEMKYTAHICSKLSGTYLVIVSEYNDFRSIQENLCPSC